MVFDPDTGHWAIIATAQMQQSTLNLPSPISVESLPMSVRTRGSTPEVLFSSFSAHTFDPGLDVPVSPLPPEREMDEEEEEEEELDAQQDIEGIFDLSAMRQTHDNSVPKIPASQLTERAPESEHIQIHNKIDDQTKLSEDESSNQRCDAMSGECIRAREPVVANNRDQNKIPASADDNPTSAIRPKPGIKEAKEAKETKEAKEAKQTKEDKEAKTKPAVKSKTAPKSKLATKGEPSSKIIPSSTAKPVPGNNPDPPASSKESNKEHGPVSGSPESHSVAQSPDVAPAKGTIRRYLNRWFPVLRNLWGDGTL